MAVVCERVCLRVYKSVDSTSHVAVVFYQCRCESVAFYFNLRWESRDSRWYLHQVVLSGIFPHGVRIFPVY